MPAECSIHHPYLPLTLQALLNLLGHTARVTEQLTLQPGPVIIPCIVLGPTQHLQLLVPRGKWVIVIACKNEESIASKFQRSLLVIVPLS